MMLDEKTAIEMIAATSQDECRQLAELFASFADTPRDVHWRAQMRRTLAMYPEPPKTTVSLAIAAGRARVAANEDRLWAEGWHPDQMREKLAEYGYTGAPTPEAPPLQ